MSRSASIPILPVLALACAFPSLAIAQVAPSEEAAVVLDALSVEGTLTATPT
ncbi:MULTISPECIES: hypothetical protein [unclassified Methylobacterium]|uniref:hypothetical protein n=1 Tax=unclassified Methylobacterium TaxID=2615210 RepID=UPI00164F1CD2|nr:MULTISPECIES: hypothetical protein [unclassified Methylobacterium]